jgi:phosphoglycerate dehydrogenase-like enzyme
MADTILEPLRIAHQLPEAFRESLASSLPTGAVLHALPPETAWEVPVGTQILIAVPPRGGNLVVPAEKPPGWPGTLRWLHAVSTGVDEFPNWIFDVPVVTCGRGTNSNAIAEFVLASLLAVEKRLPESWISSADEWRPIPGLGTLQGKTLGLLGFGSIGQAIAARAAAFGMNILAFRRTGTGADAAFPGITFAALDNVLAQADHLVIALPLTPATSGLIGPAAFARMKPGVHLVNIARGRILDHDALLAALESGQAGFASLDVTEPEPLPPGHKLYGHPKLHLSPHISWSGGDRAVAAALFTANLRRFLAGETLENIVPPGRGY